MTYPFDFADNVGSSTIADVAPGTYDLWVRWGDTDCPVDLPDVTVSESDAAPCFGILISRN